MSTVAQLEALCGKCGETFIADSFEDTVHYDNDCDGVGVLTAPRHVAVRTSQRGGAECSCGAYWKREGAAYLASHIAHFEKKD